MTSSILCIFRQNDLSATVNITINPNDVLSNQTCIFCDRDTRYEPLSQANTNGVIRKIRNVSIATQNYLLLAKIELFRKNMKFPKYHERSMRLTTYRPVDKDKRKGVKTEAFEELKKYIDTKIIKIKRCKIVKTLRVIYEKELKRICQEKNQPVPYYRFSADLIYKITRHYKKQIKVCSFDGIKILAPARHLITRLNHEAFVFQDIAFETAN